MAYRLKTPLVDAVQAENPIKPGWFFDAIRADAIVPTHAPNTFLIECAIEDYSKAAGDDWIVFNLEDATLEVVGDDTFRESFHEASE